MEVANYEHTLAPWYPAARSHMLHRVRSHDNTGRSGRAFGKGRLVRFKPPRKNMRLREPGAVPGDAVRNWRQLLSRFIPGQHIECSRFRSGRRAASKELSVFGSMVARRCRRDHRPTQAPLLSRRRSVCGRSATAGYRVISALPNIAQCVLGRATCPFPQIYSGAPSRI